MGTFQFNTVVGNGPANTNGALDCGNGQPRAIFASILWGNASDGISQAVGKCQFTSVVAGKNDTASGVTRLDPKFVNVMPMTLDVHLQDTAANGICCVDQVSPPDGGVALPAVDHDDTHRPQRTAWDIGAHELK